MGFPRQEYLSGLPLPSLRDLLDPGIKPRSPALAGRFLPSEPPGKPVCVCVCVCVCVYVYISSLQLLSHIRLCKPVDCSMPGFLVHHQLPELTQTHVHRVSDAIQPSHTHSVIPFSPCLQSFPASRSFQMSQFFASGGQSIGASASASVLPMNIQD